VLPDLKVQLVTTPLIGERKPPDASSDGGASKVTAVQGNPANPQSGWLSVGMLVRLLPIVTLIADGATPSDTPTAKVAMTPPLLMRKAIDPRCMQPTLSRAPVLSKRCLPSI